MKRSELSLSIGWIICLCFSMVMFLHVAHPQVQEVQKKMGELKGLVDECCLLADKVVKETIRKQQYLDQSKTAEGKIDKILADVAAIMQTL